MIDGLSGEMLGQLLSERLGKSERFVASGAISTENRMSPALAYGRHRGPIRSGSRLAAVAVTLFHRDNLWWVPTTLRPGFLKHHGGQVCLPGGRVEADEDVCAAARREFHEELGVECRATHFCGELSTHYVYASDNRVHPVVMIIDPPTEPWKPDPSEVEQVIEIPLRSLLLAHCRTTVIREKTVRQGDTVVDVMSFRAPAFVTGAQGLALPELATGPVIWGATAMMLDELAHLLR